MTQDDEEQRFADLMARGAELEQALENNEDEVLRANLGAVHDQIVAIVDRQLEIAVRPHVNSFRKMGGSFDFSNAKNEFFANVLSKKSGKFWDIRTETKLIGYCTNSLKNIMRSIKRKQGTRERYLASFGPWADDTEAMFNDAYDVQFDEAIESLEQWKASDDADFPLMAQIMELKLYWEMDWADMPEHLGLEPYEVGRLRKKAQRLLKRKLDENE